MAKRIFIPLMQAEVDTRVKELAKGMDLKKIKFVALSEKDIHRVAKINAYVNFRYKAPKE